MRCPFGTTKSSAGRAGDGRIARWTTAQSHAAQLRPEIRDLFAVRCLPPCHGKDPVMSATPTPRRNSTPHLCVGCGRLIALQYGHALHVKYKDFHGIVEGRADLRCRCGLVTVVVTVPAVSL
jgi:hypothetical protein